MDFATTIRTEINSRIHFERELRLGLLTVSKYGVKDFLFKSRRRRRKKRDKRRELSSGDSKP
ncbi:hypothetical protein CPC08DRAFT_715681, partial [Agrocybe pediades]